MHGLELFDIINKGVPNYVRVELDTNTMIRECASDRAKLISEIQRIKTQYEQEMIRMMGFDKYRSYFFRDFRILTSFRTARSTINISPITFIERLKNILGVKNPSVDFNDKELKHDLTERIEFLRIIKSPVILQNEFPEIYKDYVASKMTFDQLKKIEGDPSYIKYMNHQWQMYNAFGFDTRFENFVARQTQMYRNFVVRSNSVETYCDRTPIGFESFEGLDKEKFGFYVAYRYLETAKAANDFETVQNCVYYLMTYFREMRNYDISIKGDNGEVVTYRKLLTGFKKILASSKDIKPIDEDRSKFTNYHINHVINHLKKYYGNMVNWYIVPNSEEVPVPLTQEMVLGRQRNVLSSEAKQRIIDKRMALYNQKINFYENSGYAFKIFGWNEFNGYICYIYPNGKIIMDKLFNDYIKCTPAYDEAIYSIEASDFETLSKKSKQELMHSDKARRLYHSGDWEGKSRAIIEEPGKPESIAAVKKLELTFKAQKNNS